MGSARGASLPRPRVAFPEREQISSPVVVLFLLNAFVLPPDARVFLITGTIQELDAEFAAEAAASSLRPNRTSTFAHVVEIQNTVSPHACSFFFFIIEVI